MKIFLSLKILQENVDEQEINKKENINLIGEGDVTIICKFYSHNYGGRKSKGVIKYSKKLMA